MSSFAPDRLEMGRPMLFGGLRQRHDFAAAEQDLARQWQQFLALGELPGRIGSSFYGVMCGADATGFEYMCGVEVESFAGLPEGLGRMRVPAQRYAVFAHPEDAPLRSTWTQILDWLSSGSYESAHTPDFEVYSDGRIEVWVGVVPRNVAITRERPDTPDAVGLITELETHLAAHYPAESRHGFSVERLIAENVAFFVLRADGAPAACGGVKLIGNEYGEIKRMYVRPQFRGLGFAKAMLAHLEAHARTHHMELLRLETGIHQREAIALYERMGFYRIPPFGPYTDDPLSRCYEKRLA